MNIFNLVKKNLKLVAKKWMTAMSATNLAFSLVVQETQQVNLFKQLEKNTNEEDNDCCPCC